MAAAAGMVCAAARTLPGVFTEAAVAVWAAAGAAGLGVSGTGPPGAGSVLSSPPAGCQASQAPVLLSTPRGCVPHTRVACWDPAVPGLTCRRLFFVLRVSRTLLSMTPLPTLTPTPSASPLREQHRTSTSAGARPSVLWSGLGRPRERAWTGRWPSEVTPLCAC